jgi:hypothetical protein
MDPVRCPFEKAILSARCGCQLSTRKVIAERMNAGCRSAPAAGRCRELLALLRERSRFTLKITDTARELPFGKQMKISIGGLLGLQRALGGEIADPDHVADIYTLINAAEQRYGALSGFPFQEIVKSVLVYELRRRR